jgi:hypothetical protein
MVYRVWDTDSANLIADCATAEEAIEAIRRGVRFYGPDGVRHWALEREDERGTITVLAKGRDLARVAAEGIPAAR